MSGSASASSGVRGGTLRIDSRSDFDSIDPSLSYTTHGWQLVTATQLRLLSFPDKDGSDGTRLRAEAAAGLPTVSRDGRTYRFTIRRGFRFSDGTPVTAANFRAALARALAPTMQSPASSFLADVTRYWTPDPYTLVVRLKKVAPDFLARMTMPFFAAIPTNRPLDPDGAAAPLVSAGPYYVKEWVPKRTAVVVRNPYWDNGKTPWKALERPANVDRIEYTFGNSLEATRLRIEKNEADLGQIPPGAAAELTAAYGINRGRFFVRKALAFSYVVMNTASPLFRDNPRLRRAVNYAIDRPQLVRQHGYLAGARTDQILPPGMPGWRDAHVYPLAAVTESALRKAKSLAQGNTRAGKAVYYTSTQAPAPAVAQVVQYDLRQIGIDVEIRAFDPVVKYAKTGTRGEPFDLTQSNYSADYPDPFAFFNILLDGRRIQATNNGNEAYFDDPAYNRRMEAASRLSGAARLDAYNALDAAIMRDAAPLAPYIASNSRIFVSASVGCFTFSVVGAATNLVAVCKK